MPNFFVLILFFPKNYLNIFQVLENFLSFAYVNKYCVGTGISTLMSICYGLIPCIFCQKMEKTQLMWEEMDGKVFLSAGEEIFL